MLDHKQYVNANIIAVGDVVLHPLTCDPVRVTQIRPSKENNQLELRFEKAKTLSMWTTTVLKLV